MNMPKEFNAAVNAANITAHLKDPGPLALAEAVAFAAVALAEYEEYMDWRGFRWDEGPLADFDTACARIAEVIHKGWRPYSGGVVWACEVKPDHPDTMKEFREAIAGLARMKPSGPFAALV